MIENKTLGSEYENSCKSFIVLHFFFFFFYAWCKGLIMEE